MATKRSFEDYLSAWGLANSVCVQMALRAAIELDVLNIIAKSGPGAHLTAKEIFSQIPTPTSNHPKAVHNLERILRMLAVHSILSTSLKPSSNGQAQTAVQERAYGLTKQSVCLVPDENGVSLAPLVLLGSELLNAKSFSMIKETVLDAGCLPFEKAHGATMYEYLANKPEQRQLFHDSMVLSFRLFYENVFEVYKGFEEVEELMDVGGGVGSWLAKTISVHPHIRGINYDLPSVVAEAPTFPGVKHVSGNMFESIPKAKTIMLKCVLHNWDDDHCQKLLRNCWEALPETGKVIVVELAFSKELDNSAESSNIATLDIVMMLNFGGRERTTAEFDTLAKAAGFAETKAFPIGHGCYVIEFHKRAN